MVPDRSNWGEKEYDASIKDRVIQDNYDEKERGRAVQVDAGEVEKHRSQRTCYTRVSGLLPGGQNNAFECCEASGRHG